MPTVVAPLFGKAKVKLSQTPRAVTPFGGLASFLAFLQRSGFVEQVQTHLPWQLQSPNAIPLAHTFTAFVIGVVTGARRFAHTELARADRALHGLLGLPRWSGADKVRGWFHRFTQGTIQQFWRPLWAWLLGMVTYPAGGFSLDLDSTIFQRAGQQQGAAKGYNPRRPGRKSHHPILAVLAEVPLVLHGWLRSGNTGAAKGAVAFLCEALALLPTGSLCFKEAHDAISCSVAMHWSLLKKLKAWGVIVATIKPSRKERAWPRKRDQNGTSSVDLGEST